ncbi:hypothetical protein GQX74_012043 [Glossina fuscipes]|nr:hypothetical protein GQX74_012043 [Glossina fuscipes]
MVWVHYSIVIANLILEYVGGQSVNPTNFSGWSTKHNHLQANIQKESQFPQQTDFANVISNKVCLLLDDEYQNRGKRNRFFYNNATITVTTTTTTTTITAATILRFFLL